MCANLILLLLDSSRFWPASKYEAGRAQDSFDKQFLRNYLESINFDKHTSIELPQNVTNNTLEKYKEAFLLLTGKNVTL
jgi:phosphoribosylaminoimidazole-succinocarboxamide synthase